MADKFRSLGENLGARSFFGSEDGKHYRIHDQDIDPLIRRAEYLDEAINKAPAATNKNGWQYRGTIPMVWAMNWLKRNQYPFSALGLKDVKQKMAKEFLSSRDMSKLHRNHVTNKRERSKIYTGE